MSKEAPKTMDAVAALAATLHAGQVDKAGHPYIEHLRRVAAILIDRFPDASVDEIHAAYLHDAIEDAGATATSLRDSGISLRTIEIVRRLTRDPVRHPVYLNWIREIAASGDAGAMRVKLADNLDNSDPQRPAYQGAAEALERRYKPARAILEAGLDLVADRLRLVSVEDQPSQSAPADFSMPIVLD